MSPAEKYLEHLDKIFQQEPVFWGGGKDGDGFPKPTVMIYKDVPEKGFITGITYGLSLFPHEDWKDTRTELCISVQSDDERWPKVANYIAKELRGRLAFSYGQTIHLGTKVCEESEMDTFFIFAPDVLKEEEYLGIDVGADYKINITGLYPMYAEELALFEQIGARKFREHPDYDKYSVSREKITGRAT